MGHKNIEVNISVIREGSRQAYNSLISAIYKKSTHTYNKSTHFTSIFEYF
jgi:hypothetical protein